MDVLKIRGLPTEPRPIIHDLALNFIFTKVDERHRPVLPLCFKIETVPDQDFFPPLSKMVAMMVESSSMI
jgi:hypothetical protein